VDVLVVVGPADVREGRIDLQLHLGAVSRLALVQDGDSNDGFLSVANLKFAVLLVTTGDLDKSLKLKSTNNENMLLSIYFGFLFKQESTIILGSMFISFKYDCKMVKYKYVHFNLKSYSFDSRTLMYYLSFIIAWILILQVL
jgi:hypothetical protein